MTFNLYVEQKGENTSAIRGAGTREEKRCLRGLGIIYYLSGKNRHMQVPILPIEDAWADDYGDYEAYEFMSVFDFLLRRGLVSALNDGEPLVERAYHPDVFLQRPAGLGIFITHKGIKTFEAGAVDIDVFLSSVGLQFLGTLQELSDGNSFEVVRLADIFGRLRKSHSNLTYYDLVGDVGSLWYYRLVRIFTRGHEVGDERELGDMIETDLDVINKIHFRITLKGLDALKVAEHID